MDKPSCSAVKKMAEIHVRDDDKDSNYAMHYIMPREWRFSKAKETYSAFLDVPVETLSFYYKNNLVLDKDTPDSLEMKSSKVYSFDVYQVSMQINALFVIKGVFPEG